MRVVSTYDSVSNGERYCSIIIKMDAIHGFDINNRKTITINGTIFSCGEYLQSTQCYKCSRFGYIAENCLFEISCRKCTEKHTHKECTNEVRKCTNCIREGFQLVDHSATYEGCPYRRQHINLFKLKQ